MQTSEVAKNSKISPLQMAVQKKGAPVPTLNIQYRMCPAIATLVSGFYDNEMETHASAIVDNVAREHYDQKDPQEVVFINVDRGVSRVEPNGTSIQNYANADAMLLAVERCLAAGILASQISIITFYRGRKNLVQLKIGDGKLREVGTVDAYQGRQNDVIFVDYVTARQSFSNYHESLQDWDPEVTTRDEDEFGALTAHVKNPNRNCVALSRARCGLFIFGQKFQLSKNDGGLFSRLKMEFCDNRRVAYLDSEHLDTHPLALAKRVTMTKEALANEQQQEAKNRYRIYAEVRRGWSSHHANPQSSGSRVQSQQQLGQQQWKHQGNKQGNQQGKRKLRPSRRVIKDRVDKGDNNRNHRRQHGRQHPPPPPWITLVKFGSAEHPQRINQTLPATPSVPVLQNTLTNN